MSDKVGAAKGPFYTSAAETWMREVAAALDISDSRYESAERSYRSVADWLERSASRFATHNLHVYPQGSFRIGTAIRPADDEERYDLDVVLEDRSIFKSKVTQEKLQDLLGLELHDYAESHGMEPPERGRFCWTLRYADGAQFAMDVLPALPDSASVRVLLEKRQLPTEWVDTAVSIPDARHPNFRYLSEDWRTSNPAGFAAWFQSRQQTVFEARRRALALEQRLAKAEEIPHYRVKTPLQEAVQILKRHRDVYFSKTPSLRPSSVLITTLSATAYEQQTDVLGSVLGILMRLDQSITVLDGQYWVANPADRRENFADVWREQPLLRQEFLRWHRAAVEEFQAIANTPDRVAIARIHGAALGQGLAKVIEARSGAPGALRKVVARATGALRDVLQASHKQAPRWPVLVTRSARIERGTFTQKGFRPREFSSDSAALPKGADLRFELATNVESPYQVYWQVVNTGSEAAAVPGGLRGGFDEGSVERGKAIRVESTKYRGSHSIEGFVVKNGYCVASTGPFVVNIE